MDSGGTGAVDLLEIGTSYSHKRSKSYSNKKQLGHIETQDSSSEVSKHVKISLDKEHLKKQSPNAIAQNSLRKEILQLEKRLEDQVAVRCVLEKALGNQASSSLDIASEVSVPEPTIELIKDIAVLEREVVHLEHYLLSLYRKAFDQEISSSSSPSIKTQGSKSPYSNTVSLSYTESSPRIENGQLFTTPLRCHSSVSQPQSFSPKLPTKVLRSCHSQPLSLKEYSQNANIASLADHLGTRISDHVPVTPNKLSEDMIRCMSAIYCKLADSTLSNNGLSSPTSSLSSTNAFSPKDHSAMWSPVIGKASPFDVQLDNPFHIQGLKEFSGPYSTMVEVQCIFRDIQNLGEIEHMLQKFKALISQLEDIDPNKMENDEKLAFWINVHNALVMHAFLAYGIPQNSVKRIFLLLKAAYNVGGHVLSADVIQNCILGCRMSRPGQWLRMLLPSRTKFKAGDTRQAYAIEQPEPLLHFALCCGSHSDPAVRVYTPKRVHEELESAKEEYIRATFGVRKDHKILLPKIVESFTKDSGFSTASIMKMLQECLPQSFHKNIDKCQQVKSRKIIEWVPHNFAFRYLVSKELLK
jgi:hypothetical protein